MTVAEEKNNYMKRLIETFPDNLTEALAIAKKNPLKKHNSKFNNVVMCGMGGSGIGGKLVASWIQDELSIPILFCQDYSIPKFINESTLVIASSNSGNTEETLSSTMEARLRGARIVGICSGGKLEAFCSEWNLDYILIPGGMPPRAALAYSVVQMIHILSELGLINDSIIDNFKKSADFILSEQSMIKDVAKKLADFIYDKQLMIYSDSKGEGVSIRARQQYNENCKLLVNHHVIPEMNHNELLGWTGGSEKYGVLIINSGDLSSKNLNRLQFSLDFIKKKTPHVFTIEGKGTSIIERSLFLINIIDWSSLYYAENQNIDSVEINVIEDLKKHLIE